MDVTVRFQGTLGRNVPDYDATEGVLVKLPQGATLNDLFKQLNIADPQKTIVTMDYRILNVEDTLHHGAEVKIFQLLSGG
jgi:sulfur carrier protein ThiS